MKKLNNDIYNYGGVSSSVQNSKGSSSFLTGGRSPSEGRYRISNNNYSDQKLVIRRGELVRRSMEPLAKNASLPDIHKRNPSNKFSSIEAEHPYRQSSKIRNLISQKTIPTIYDEE